MRNLENDNRTLESLCTEILELNRKKQDYIAPTNQLQVQTVINEDGPNTTQIIMEADHGEKTKILNANDVCLDQMNVKTVWTQRSAVGFKIITLRNMIN